MSYDKQISISQLTQLKDFPDYYINLENGDVYSFLQRTGWAATKKKVLRKLNGKLQGRNERNQQRVFTLRDSDGNIRYAMHGRLMIAASRNISYYIIPKDINCNFRDGEITMHNHSESAREGHLSALREHNIDILNKIDRGILTLQLLQTAYLGDRRPLLEYVYKHKELYIRTVCIKMRWKNSTAKESVLMAIDRLLETIKGEHIADIMRLDNWIVNTAIGLMRNQIRENRIKRVLSDNSIIHYE